MCGISNLDRSGEVGLLPPEPEQGADGPQDEHGLHEGRVVNQSRG